MSLILAVKLPPELKRKVKELRDRVDWPEEIRSFVKKRIREIEAEQNMRRVVDEIKKTGGVPKGFSVTSVREDRESS